MFLEGNSILDAVSVHQDSVLAPEILNRSLSASHDDPGVPTRECRGIDAHGTVAITPDEIRAFGQTPLAIAATRAAGLTLQRRRSRALALAAHPPERRSRIGEPCGCSDAPGASRRARLGLL